MEIHENLLTTATKKKLLIILSVLVVVLVAAIALRENLRTQNIDTNLIPEEVGAGVNPFDKYGFAINGPYWLREFDCDQSRALTAAEAGESKVEDVFCNNGINSSPLIQVGWKAKDLDNTDFSISQASKLAALYYGAGKQFTTKCDNHTGIATTVAAPFSARAFSCQVNLLEGESFTVIYYIFYTGKQADTANWITMSDAKNPDNISNERMIELAKGILMLRPENKTSWLNNFIPQVFAGVDDSSGGSGSGGSAGDGSGVSDGGTGTSCCVTAGDGTTVTSGDGSAVSFGGPQAPTFGSGGSDSGTSGGGSSATCFNGANNYPTCSTCPASQTMIGGVCLVPLSCPSGLPANITTNYRCYAPAYTWSGHNGDQSIPAAYTAWQTTPITTIAGCGIMPGQQSRTKVIQTSSTQTCPVVVAPPITAGPVDAICAPTHYSCSIGSSVNNVSNATQWDWQCDGYNGGNSATCSELVGSIPPPVPPPTPAPTVTLTATPSTIDNGDSSDLTWVVTNATNCNASGGTWTGPKSTTGGTDSVSPVVNTTYTLSCTGIGGTTVDTVTVNLPDGSIGAAGCTIMSGNTTCPAGVVWTSSNFLGQPQVLHGTTTFSNAPASTVTNFIPVTPTTNVFTLRDAGGTFIDVATASVGCDASSVWVPSLSICAPLPTITIVADPNVIRSGTPATLDIEIDALYDLACTLNDGGGVRNISHTGAATPTPYSEVTRNLTSAQIVTIECTSVLYPPVTGSGEARVNVVPTIQEI